MGLLRPSNLENMLVNPLITKAPGFYNLPISRSRQIPHRLRIHCLRHKSTHRMTDKQIGLFDTLPEVRPCLSLWRRRVIYQITSNLNMTAINHRPIGSGRLDEWNQAGHLRIIDHHDISSTVFWRIQWPAFSEPVTFGVGCDPVVQLLFVLFCEALVESGYALENVVVCLGDTEHPWFWSRDVPIEM